MADQRAHAPHAGTWNNMQFTITLSCGCTVRTRNAPMNERAKMGCTTGQRHGYSLPWTSCLDLATGSVTTNKRTTQ